ncbi:MAG TPA: hypothetical protein VG253_09070 [Streptosporangiaceae bacterium]|nr:hypothetical protein [Streptosporangiaceae bacterium]
MKRRREHQPHWDFLAHRGLIGVSAGFSMAEAAILVAVAPSARALAPQLTALPPLAVFHDLRWLYAYERSWAGFVLLLVGVIAARAGLNAVVIRLAWPREFAPPPPRELLRAGVVLAVAACLLLSPIVALTFGVAILPFSWPFFAVLPVMLLLSIPLSHGGASASWWRTLPPAPAVAWLLADFAQLSVAAGLIGSLSVPWAIPIAGLAGIVNARAWYGMTRAVARKPVIRRQPAHCKRRVPMAPVATIVAIGLVIGLTRLAFIVGNPQSGTVADAMPQGGKMNVTAASSLGGQAPVARQTVTSAHDRHRDPVLVIRGFGSTCCASQRSMQYIAPGALVRQFSYLGMSPTGQPLPQGPSASDLPLPELGNLIAAQVLRLHQESGKPVDLIAESEGSLGVDAMLASHPHIPLGSVVLMSPIVAPGQASYPAGTGPGIVPGGELQGIVWFVGGLSPFGTAGAQTLISSVNSDGARFAAAAARYRPLRWLTLVPLADAVTLPVCTLPKQVVVVPALHGDLLGNPSVKTMVRDFLAGTYVPLPQQFKGTAELVAAAAAAWRMPQASPPSPPCGH